MPTVSLCMIVRNEERSIRRCLESAVPFVDEIVIADTGSIDGTKQICAKYGARLSDFEWADDFAAARNFCLEKASCDWILWLDADEELQVFDFPALRSCLEDRREDFLSVRMLHFYGPEPADGTRSYLSCSFRLFRNGSGIRYAGRIHERLTAGASGAIPQLDPNRYMRILHYGYMESALNNKSNRNIGLLLKEKEGGPDDAWLDYHLAAEYHRLRDYDRALRSINRAIIGFLGKGLLPPPLAYRLKYDVLTAASRLREAYPGIVKAVALYPDYVDLHYFKGLAQFAIAEYERAAETFSYCLVLGDTNPNYLILSGVADFLPLYYMGLCYENMQKYAEAAEAYRQATAFHPGFDPAGQRLSALGEGSGMKR